jgi:DNA-binding SARP family transcriptional activator
VAVLGPLSADRHGMPIDLGGRRQRAVLARLVVAHGDVVPADQLVDALWGENPPAEASAALQAHISHLRRRLEPDRPARGRGTIITRAGPGYTLRLPADSVDAWRFQRLVREATSGDDAVVTATTLATALELWRGPAYADYAEDAWAQPEVNRLTQLRAVAREKLVAARLAAGESAVLIPEIESLLAEEPLSEERWRLLVVASYRAHRQADALSALRRARKTLADELGVDPGPALRALEAEVLAQSPALEPDVPEARAVAAQQGPADDLVDRTRELADLESCLDEAFSGTACLALIEGPAGIGKSRLLAETRRMASIRDATILTARGSQMEREYGFGAVRQLFEPVLADRERRDRLLSGSADQAHSVFETTAGHQARTETSFSMLNGLYWLTANLAATRPAVLSIDDLQWCDNGSLRFLAYLLRRLEGLGILIIATVRTGDDYLDPAVLDDIAQDPATVQIRPAPLTLPGVAHLVRRQLDQTPDDRFVHACHSTTSGNPLLLRQLLRALASDRIPPDASHADTVTAFGSRAVSSMVLMRLRRMPPANTAVARAVAVLGEGAELPAVAALCGLPEPDVAAAITALVRAELMRDGLPLGFVHPLIGEAIYRDLPSAERALRHEEAARVLHRMAATPERLAAHLLKMPSRGDPWVVAVLRRAALEAAERGAPESATTYLGRALAEPPDQKTRPFVLLELGQFQVLCDGAGAVKPLSQAYSTLTDPAAHAAVALVLARTLVFVGPPARATSFAQRAAAELPPEIMPRTECLADVVDRMLPYWYDGIVPDLRRGQAVAVVAHGNSLRALVKHLDGMSDEAVVALNIPTGIPLVYQLDEQMRPVKTGGEYLDPEAAAEAIQAVANQGR